FYLLILTIAVCGWLMWRPTNGSVLFQSEQGATGEAMQAPAPTWRDAASWAGLASVPAGLLVAVTAHISTDVGAVPLLWVVPLALYLLTFVIVFSRWSIIPHRFVIASQPFFVIGLVAVIVGLAALLSGLVQTLLSGIAF